jgi:hypothetical protein
LEKPWRKRGELERTGVTAVKLLGLEVRVPVRVT